MYIYIYIYIYIPFISIYYIFILDVRAYMRARACVRCWCV